MDIDFDKINYKRLFIKQLKLNHEFLNDNINFVKTCKQIIINSGYVDPSFDLPDMIGDLIEIIDDFKSRSEDIDIDCD